MHMQTCAELFALPCEGDPCCARPFALFLPPPFFFSFSVHSSTPIESDPIGLFRIPPYRFVLRTCSSISLTRRHCTRSRADRCSHIPSPRDHAPTAS